MAIRDLFYSEHFQNISTSDNVIPVTKVSLTFSPIPNGNYFLFWTANLVSNRVSSGNPHTHIDFINNTTSNILSNQSLLAFTNPAQRPLGFGFAKLNANANPGTQEFSIRIRPNIGISQLSSCKSGMIAAFTANVNDGYAENLVQGNTTSATFIPHLRYDYNAPATGDYYVVAMAELNMNGTVQLGANIYTARLVHAANIWANTKFEPMHLDQPVDDQWRPWGAITKVALATGTRTFNIEYAKTQSVGVGVQARIRNARILIMPSNSFFGTEYSNNGLQITSITSFSALSSQTISPITSGTSKYLSFFYILGGNANNIAQKQIYRSTVTGNNKIQWENYRPVNTTLSGGSYVSFFANSYPSATSQTWQSEQAISFPSLITSTFESSILIINFGNDPPLGDSELIGTGVLTLPTPNRVRTEMANASGNAFITLDNPQVIPSSRANINVFANISSIGSFLTRVDSSLTGSAILTVADLSRTFSLTQINNALIDNLTLNTTHFQNDSIESRHYTAASITKKNVEVGWWTSIESNIFSLETGFAANFINVRSLQNVVGRTTPNLTANTLKVAGGTLTNFLNVFNDFETQGTLLVNKQYVDNRAATANQYYLDHRHNTITSTTGNIYFTGQGPNNVKAVKHFLYSNGRFFAPENFIVNVENGSIQLKNSSFTAGQILAVDWYERRHGL